LEKRIEILEKAIPDIRERLATIETKLNHAATSKDISYLKTLLAENRTAVSNDFGSQTKWFIGTAIALAVIAFSAARFIPGG